MVFDREAYMKIYNKRYRKKHLLYYRYYGKRWREDNPSYYKDYFKKNCKALEEKRLKRIVEEVINKDN